MNIKPADFLLKYSPFRLGLGWLDYITSEWLFSECLTERLMISEMQILLSVLEFFKIRDRLDI